MRNVLDMSLKNLKWIKIRNKRMANVLLLLSFVVTIGVFWGLRQPGLTLAGDATCGIVEHTHDDECGTKICICDLSEEQHIHDDLCYEVNWVEGEAEIQLICEDTDENHIHTDDCFIVEEAEAYEELILTCDLSEEAHIHEEECYEWDLTCELEEHVHSIACYSDSTADVETVLDWEEMFADYPYTGDLRKDLVGIAMTQVGYSESELNFEVGDDGIRHGYTRYGAWYGTPYRDWSAMFVSFCLNYAGADMDETPGNTGAKSMAKRWNKLGKYAEADEYIPVNGDLVFFDDNTVGIVVEKQDTTVYVVRGDVDDAVETELFALTDDEIIGWGSTVGTMPEIEKPSDPKLRYEDYMLDISNGPALYLFAGGEVEQEGEVFSFKNSRSATDLLSYLEANDGDYFFTLLNMENEPLPKDDDGNYIVVANTGYKLTITFNSPNGFKPGTYQYQVPNGLMVDGGKGAFVIDDVEVGSWVVTDTGFITMVFNEHMNSLTETTISAALGIHFPEQEEPIDFDGKITVTVEKPPQQLNPTKLTKWGNQGGTPGAGDDPSKIYWKLEIIGDEDSQIPGSILTDKILDGQYSKTHRFTESDIAAGLTIGVTDANGGWHSWKVTADDPHLNWTAKGWEYKIPQTAVCQWCGELELGNEGWYYYVDYTSTPDLAGATGIFGYENEATIDGAYGYAWVNFTHGEVVGEISKNGSFISDAAGGKFLWEVRTTIPGRKEGEKTYTRWLFTDTMTLVDEDSNWMANVTNDIDKSTVTMEYKGETIHVPRIQDATKDDDFVWMHYWSNEPGDDGIYNQRAILILGRCNCTEENCAFDECWGYPYAADDGTWFNTSDFCPCWTETEDTLFTFTYQTDGIDIIADHNGLAYDLKNQAILYYDETTEVDRDNEKVPLPSVLEKALTHEFDGYVANYRVTVNEGKLMLTDGTPLTIHDMMTDTLAYISGSLVITAEDKNGNVTTLKQDRDYTVTYDGTGNQTDDRGNEVHVLDIVILHPQPAMYTLDYDATLIMPDKITEGIKYTNSAMITLWGEDFSDTSLEKVHADINISAKSYKVEMFKTCAETGEPLAGATFGLYNEHGGLIATDVTDANGELLFQTNIIEGIILREHVLYYMQEMEAPTGYQLDDTKYWFCFCDKTDAFCAECQEILGETEAIRIPFEQIGKVHATNQIMNYNLPSTGGFGIYPLILASVMLILTPPVYIFIQRRKRERRRARRYSRTSANRRRR